MLFKHTEVFNFEGAFRGMRNPLESWGKSDSRWEFWEDPSPINPNDEFRFIIGENDLALAQRLIRSGPEHRKFMRQIFVCVDITAPLYWWKEFDTYKVGTVANSTSTMHKLASTPITIDCFEIGDYAPDLGYHLDDSGDSSFWEVVGDISESLIEGLEKLRQRYLETKDKRYWKELIRWLPNSWLQTRTVTLTYENLLAMCSKGQRRFHKLNEWSGIDEPSLANFISWVRSLPYAPELIFIDEVKE